MVDNGVKFSMFSLFLFSLTRTGNGKSAQYSSLSMNVFRFFEANFDPWDLNLKKQSLCKKTASAGNLGLGLGVASLHWLLIQNDWPKRSFPARVSENDKCVSGKAPNISTQSSFVFCLQRNITDRGALRFNFCCKKNNVFYSKTFVNFFSLGW